MAALHDRWPFVFEHTRGISVEIAAEYLAHAKHTTVDTPQLDMHEFAKCLEHPPHSASGPDGLIHSTWTHAGDGGAKILFDCYLA